LADDMGFPTDAAHAANYRAFNEWLVNDWLDTYPHNNVAVFDYYNVLTDPANHHRWNGSAIEHVQAKDSNFSAYPSGDSHPSTEGHTKATAEFVPLLNVFYNRWQAGGVVAPPPTVEPTEPAPAEATEAAPEATTAPVATTSSGIDDFEGDLEWYADLGDNATLTCSTDGDAHSGAAALRIAYTIPAESWGGCGRYYDAAQDWSDGTGLSLWLRTDEPGQWITLLCFSGSADAGTPFEFGFEITEDWAQVVIPWADFARASWADEGGLTEIDPARMMSLGFSLGEGKGNLWVDDVATFSGAAPPEPPAPDQPAEEPPATEQPSTPTPEPTDTPRGRGGLCASAPLALSLLGVGFVIQRRRA